MEIKKISKIVFFTLVVFSFIFINTTKVLAVSPTISIGSASVLPGDNINIPVSITNAVNVKSLTFRIIYDGNLLTYNGYTASYPTPSGTGTISVTSEPGGIGLKYVVVWTADSSFSGDFIPVTFDFTVKSPMTVTLPSTIQFGGASGRFIYNNVGSDIKNTFTFTNGTITATPITLSSIAITHPANKLSYYVGDTLDIGGLEVAGTYNDSSTTVETVTSGNITGFDSSVPATGQVLTVTVGSKTTTYTVDISAIPVTLSSIAITHPANKLSYFVGQSLDISGLEVTGTYSNASTQVETITSGNVTGFDSSTPITGQTLIVTVGDKTANYDINVIVRPIFTIGSASVLPGEHISIPISVTDATDIKNISFNFLYSGDLLTYNDYTSNYPTTGSTTVSSPVVAGQGLRITVSWTGDSSVDGSLVPVTLNFTVKSPITVTLPATLAFGGLSGTIIRDSSSTEIKNFTTFTNGTITATPITLSSIAITHPANKLSYYVGDTLDIGGLEVTGTYNDSSTTVETVTSGNITGFDSSVPATGQVLTVTVGSKTTTYTVDISAIPVTLSSIAITHPANKLSYFVGQSLDISGLEVTGTYSNASTQVETITSGNVTGFDSSTSAVGQVLTVTVGSKIATYNIDINVVVVSSGGGGYYFPPTQTPVINTISPVKADILAVVPANDITPVSVQAPFIFTLKLFKGSKNSEVTELQKILNIKGFNCGTPDGIFGFKTRSAVIKFQLKNKLAGDGVVGPKTRALLN